MVSSALLTWQRSDGLTFKLGKITMTSFTLHCLIQTYYPWMGVLDEMAVDRNGGMKMEDEISTWLC